MEHIKSFIVMLIYFNFTIVYAGEDNLTIAQILARSQRKETHFNRVQPEESELAQFLLKHCPKQVKDIVFCLQHPALFEQADFPTRLLFVGPPGVGKTTLAVAIAQHCQRPNVIIKCSMIGNKYQNSGPNHIKEQIEPLLAGHEPCVIIVDEINLLAEKFNDESFPDKKTASAFWQYLDEVEQTKQALFIGTANDITSLPAPLKDRFEGNIVEICMPGAQLKREIMQFYLKDIEHSQPMITALMKKIKHFSGRKIKQLIERAKRKAVIRTNAAHPMVIVRDIQAAIEDFCYTQGWRTWLNAHWKQIEKATPHIMTWTLTAIGLYLNYYHYQRLMPMNILQ